MLTRTMAALRNRQGDRASAIRAAGLVWIWSVFSVPLVEAAPPSVCHSYATNAVAQQATNNFQDCGFGGDRWNSNFGGHYDWCLGQSEGTLEVERAGRQADLDKCTRLSLIHI